MNVIEEVIFGFYFMSRDSRIEESVNAAAVWFALFMMLDVIVAIELVRYAVEVTTGVQISIDMLIYGALIMACAYVFGFFAYFKIKRSGDNLISIDKGAARVLKMKSLLFGVIAMFGIVLVFALNAIRF